MKIICAYCGEDVEKENTAVNKANKEHRSLYCNKKCAGLGRRDKRTADQKKADKATYDAKYRAANKELLKTKKAAWFQQSYDPIEAAKKRKINMPRHVEYCRQPEYVAKKKNYDRDHRAKKKYGELWETAILILKIDDEILKSTTKHQIRLDNGLANKKQMRRREYERLNSNKSERCPLGNA